MIHLLQTHNVHIEHGWISADAQLSDELQGPDCVYTLGMANVGKVWSRQGSYATEKEAESENETWSEVLSDPHQMGV